MTLSMRTVRLLSAVWMAISLGHSHSSGQSVPANVAPQSSRRSIQVAAKYSLPLSTVTCEKAVLTNDAGVFTAESSSIRNAGGKCEIEFSQVRLDGAIAIVVDGKVREPLSLVDVTVQGSMEVPKWRWLPKTWFGSGAIDLGTVQLRKDVPSTKREVALEVTVQPPGFINMGGASCSQAGLRVSGKQHWRSNGVIDHQDGWAKICTVRFDRVPINSEIEVRVIGLVEGDDYFGAKTWSSKSRWWRNAGDRGVAELKVRFEDGVVDIPGSSPPDIPREPTPPEPQPPSDERKVPACSTHGQGDANCDGVVNLFDCAIVMIEIEEGRVDRGDFNRDGRVDSEDLRICESNAGGEGEEGPRCELHPRGDANCDGVVNSVDHSITLAEIDAGVSDRADFNGDGVVNMMDLAIVQANFGTGVLGLEEDLGGYPEPDEGNGSYPEPEEPSVGNDDGACPLYAQGDINCDGEVNAQDVTDAIRAVAGFASAIDADINGDGSVDKADLEFVREAVERWVEQNR